MVRRSTITLLILSLVAVFFFGGCDYDVQPLPDTGIYELKYVLGQYYLDFDAGNERLVVESDGCIVVSPKYLECTSVEELYQKLTKCNFTDDELDAIRQHCMLDEENGFIMPNPNKLYSPQLPNGVNITNLKVQHINGGEPYVVNFKSETESIGGPDVTGYFYILSTERYNELINNFLSPDSIPTTHTLVSMHDYGDALVHDVEVDGIQTFRYVRYSVQIGPKIFFISEKYRIAGEEYLGRISETIPISATVYGCNNDVCFLYNFQLIDTSVQNWLEILDVIPYTP